MSILFIGWTSTVVNKIQILQMFFIIFIIAYTPLGVPPPKKQKKNFFQLPIL